MARVLVVEDDPDQLHVRVQLLEFARHEVRPASSLAEAISLLAEFGPEVMVMDLRLPELEDGLRLIRAAGQTTPRIVVVSGWPEDLEGRPEANRVARILHKPAPTRILLDIIRQLTDSPC